MPIRTPRPVVWSAIRPVPRSPLDLRSTAATAALWTPQSDMDTHGGLWWDSQELASGAVASWQSKEGLAHFAAQNTAGARPTKGATGVVFDGGDGLARVTLTGDVADFVRSATIPDGLGMPPGSTGKGVTCTGLCRVPNTNQFWIANHGDSSSAKDNSGPFAPSLIRFSYSNGTITKLEEIALAALVPGIESIQGVTYDTSDNTLWFASALAPSLLKVYHINPSTGALIADTITPSWAPGGIAYVPSEDAIWIAQNSTSGNNIEKRSCATGNATIASATTGLTNQDHLSYDASTGHLLLSYGGNGSPGLIRVYGTSGASGALAHVGEIQTPALAIEGIVAEGRKLYVANDAYYHTQSPNLNELIEYDIVPPLANVLSVHLTAGVSATTSADCYFECGGGSDGPIGGFGFGVYPASTTTLTVAANTATSGTTQRGIISGATVSSMATSLRLIDILFDVPNDLVSLWVDGTAVTTASLSALVGGISTAGQCFIGTSINNRNITGTIRDVIFVAGLSNRVKMEGYRAHRWGLTANLPSNHAHKTSAPTI